MHRLDQKKSITHLLTMQKISILLLLGYSDNYSVTSGSLWNYYRDEMNDSANENNDADNYGINNNKTTTSKFFEDNAKIIGRTSNDNNILNAADAVLLKYLIKFWTSLELPLINCEIKLDLSWSRNCVVSEISRTAAVAENLPVAATATTSARFRINNKKLYVPVVTFSIHNNIKCVENTKQGFKRTISRNKYRSETTTKPKNNNLDYLIDPTLRNINKLFVLSFKNYDNDPTRNPFDKYYMPLVEIKDFNALIDNKPFFDQPVKKKQEAY